jgi:AcrR family transcriptional regulator
MSADQDADRAGGPRGKGEPHAGQSIDAARRLDQPALDNTNDRAYIRGVGRGEATRHAILERAAGLASQVGLEGVTIGRLADELALSKSGLFAHFHSKETLQVQTLQFAAQLFVDQVIRPALKAPRGTARLRALYERWLAWARESPLPGGCLFIQAASELDDREGVVRDELVRQQRDWLELIANVARTAVAEGQFRPDADVEQLAHDLNGSMLAFHHAHRLLRDPAAERRARRAFEALIQAASPTGASGRPRARHS